MYRNKQNNSESTTKQTKRRRLKCEKLTDDSDGRQVMEDPSFWVCLLPTSITFSRVIC
jgi:hypothetical protein